jgi:spermidine synthase
MLGLVFGVTVFAASTVWATFMAGLALGSFAAGRVGDRVRRPLVWFGAAETSIGLSALASPTVLHWLQEIYPAIHRIAPESLAMLTLVRFGVAVAVLIVPTTLMGATLPLVVKSSFAKDAEFGSRVSLLYGTNTAGAILGTLAAGLWLIPHLGLQASFQTAAVTNVVVGTIAVLAGLVMPAAARVDQTVAEAHGEAGEAPESVRRIVLAVFAVSGFATLALEVVWFRVSILLLRPTVYGFAILLATVLLGIALGSWMVTPFMRQRRDWVRMLGLLEVGMAFAVLFSFVFMNTVPSLADRVEPYIARVMAGWLAFPIVGAVPAILPSALLMGLAFPIGLRIYVGGESGASARAASRIGVFYSSNVFGAILGSLAAGFFLLPWFGSRATLIGVAATILTSGLVLLALSLRGARRVAVTAVVVIGFAVLAARMADPFEVVTAVRYASRTEVWREEAVQGTVAVLRGPGEELGLYLEGNHQASEQETMLYVHRRIGHLPLAIHPNPRIALVVGLGGGATAGAAAVHPGVQVDVVELSAAVIKAARYFERINHGVLDRPNVTVRVDDGRNYLLTTDKKYDVITADLILPMYAGSNNIYSADYFRLVRRALRPGGIALQWVDGTDAEYKTIMRSFLSVFPHATLWADRSLMIGSLEPLKLSRAAFEAKLQLPGQLDALKELGITTFDELKKAYIAGPDEMRAFVGDGPILTDDRPLVEYFLSLPRTDLTGLERLKGDVRPHLIDE